MHWEDRLTKGEILQGGAFENTFIAIDTTECPIASGQGALYSGYKKDHTLKYEAAVSIVEGIFVWAPVPGLLGPGADQDACRFYHIADQMKKNEKYLGDGHYVGLEKSLVRDMTEFQKVRDEYGHVRAIVEHAFSRMKNFSCMEYHWRYDVAKHYLAYKLCVHLTNIIFRTKPLHTKPHPLVFQYKPEI